MAYKKEQTNHYDRPIYWFAILETARERNDQVNIMLAKRELERLGVIVRYFRPCDDGACIRPKNQ